MREGFVKASLDYTKFAHHIYLLAVRKRWTWPETLSYFGANEMQLFLLGTHDITDEPERLHFIAHHTKLYHLEDPLFKEQFFEAIHMKKVISPF
jgi:hypothetical protein